MSLSDGDPADDGDIWFRIATQQGHLVRGRVHHSALGGSAIAPPKKSRPWDRELSGRLRTLAGTVDEITAHAERYCEALTAKGQGKKSFFGLMYVRVRDGKRSYNDTLTTAVHYTPSDEDRAHADLTFKGWIGNTQEDRDRFILWITDILRALHHPGQVELLPEAEDTRPLVAKLFDYFRRVRWK
jgi:hypothetical protein